MPNGLLSKWNLKISNKFKALTPLRLHFFIIGFLKVNWVIHIQVKCKVVCKLKLFMCSIVIFHSSSTFKCNIANLLHIIVSQSRNKTLSNICDGVFFQNKQRLNTYNYFSKKWTFDGVLNTSPCWGTASCQYEL